MLRIDLQAVEESPVEVSGTISADDAVFDEIDLDLRSPVSVSGRVLSAGGGRFYWRGRIEAVVGGQCRRCLVDVESPVDARVELLFSEDPDAEDPSSYEIRKDAPVLDLKEPVREELVLGAPPFALCRDDCAGLCTQCGKDLNAGTCECKPAVDQRWAGLEALRDTLPRDEES